MLKVSVMSESSFSETRTEGSRDLALPSSRKVSLKAVRNKSES